MFLCCLSGIPDFWDLPPLPLTPVGLSIEGHDFPATGGHKTLTGRPGPEHLDPACRAWAQAELRTEAGPVSQA